jgi:hypothetical protein
MTKATAIIQERTTSQMIVEWPRSADLLFWFEKGEEPDDCGDAAMMKWLFGLGGVEEVCRFRRPASSLGCRQSR